MGYHAMIVPGFTTVHASPVEDGSIFYCETEAHPMRSPFNVGSAKVTCLVCREALAKIWEEIITGDNPNQYVYYVWGRKGLTKISQVEPRQSDDGRRFIRFIGQAVDEGLDLPNYFTLENFINILIDGNANTVEAGKDGQP